MTVFGRLGGRDTDIPGAKGADASDLALGTDGKEDGGNDGIGTLREEMPSEGLVDWQYLARINFLCRARTEFQGLIEIELQGRARTVSRDLVRTELVDSLKVGSLRKGRVSLFEALAFC